MDNDKLRVALRAPNTIGVAMSIGFLLARTRPGASLAWIAAGWGLCNALVALGVWWHGRRRHTVYLIEVRTSEPPPLDKDVAG